MNARAEGLPGTATRWGAVPNSLRQGAIASLPLPDRETMNALAPFEALKSDQVQVVTTAEAAEALLARWQAGVVLGFGFFFVNQAFSAFGSAVVGGGTNTVPVFCNGSAWLIG